MMGLTAPQARLYEFIVAYNAEHRQSPSLREIASGVGIAQSNVQRTLGCLKERGFIDWMPHRARSIVVLAGGSGPSFTLPPTLGAKLARFCWATGEAADDVIIDAVTLHLDSFEPADGSGALDTIEQVLS